MCLLSLSYPTTFIKNCCWWLRQLLSLGVGWQDCQYSPTRTVHHSSWLHNGREKPSRTLHYVGLTIFCSPPRTGFTRFSLPLTHSPLHACAEHSHTSNSRPLCSLFIHAQAGSCSSSGMNHCLLTVLTHRYSSVLDSHSELGVVCLHPRFDVLTAVSLTWWLLGVFFIFGMGVCPSHAQFESLYFSLPQRAYVCFYRWLRCPRVGCCFFPYCELAHWYI